MNGLGGGGGGGGGIARCADLGNFMFRGFGLRFFFEIGLKKSRGHLLLLLNIIKKTIEYETQRCIGFLPRTALRFMKRKVPPRHRRPWCFLLC
mmetsp:Transcript_11583/g.24572  ORF Transcript_11583/g.24572 Transcript_11583/m.24572 type:complete len:93 (+) Transcript_11583:1025-1303(+)